MKENTLKPQLAFFLILVLASVHLAAAEPDFTAFDQSITGLMAKYQIAGAAMAVARDGKLVIARAYGLADRERQEPVRPDSLFRIGSISKTFTAAGVLKLVEEGRLDLDAKAFSILDRMQPPSGKTADSRLRDITIRQLLQHTGGWDRDISGDPIGMGPEAARALHIPAPVGVSDLIRFSMGLRLDFDPGARWAYSNLGYLILGRVIETVTHMPYEDYVKLAVLAPAGIRRMQIAHGSLAGRAEGEVKYYDLPGAPLVWTYVRGGDPIVPLPYAMPLETWDASSAWIASAVDLVRFNLALDPRSGRALLLQPDTLQKMLGDRAALPASANRFFYGLGWFMDVPKDGSDIAWFHGGNLSGTAAIVMHRPDGIVYAVLFNWGPTPWIPSFGDSAASGDAHQAFTAAIDSMKEWPTVDLFPQYQ